MKRRVFLTKGAAGVFALGAVGCSKNDTNNPLASSSGNAVISGMIADPEGNGVQWASITLAGNGINRSAVTDENGKFSIEVPKNGEYTLYPVKAGYNFNPSSQKIAVTNSQSFVVNIMAIIVNISSGRITTRELGKTGITVSNFGFGSHVERRNTGTKREYMIREAIDRGITTYDVYDFDGNTYQYEPMGKYLAPVINDVVLSINITGSTLEEELENAFNGFGRDYIDMVRLQNHKEYPNKEDKWYEYYDVLFRYKEQGKIRAVGVPCHDPITENIDKLLDTYPIDFVFFPFNFYHNIGWPPDLHPESFVPFAQMLREKDIGVVAIKPFAGDYFIKTLKDAAAEINPDLSFTQAALRYVINSGLEPDTTFTGINLFDEFLENIQAYYEPEMSDDEQVFLDEVKAVAEKKAHAVLPDHYRFLDKWAPEHGKDQLINFA